MTARILDDLQRQAQRHGELAAGYRMAGARDRAATETARAVAVRSAIAILKGVAL